MEKSCYLFIGLQASGKTTFYHRYFSDIAHVNLDTLHTRYKESLLIEECIASGKPFVVDNTNPTREKRARYIRIAKEKGYRVIGYYFQSSVFACKERNECRTGKAQVPVSAILSTHAKLELPSLSEGFDELYYVSIRDGTFDVEPWSEEG